MLYTLKKGTQEMCVDLDAHLAKGDTIDFHNFGECFIASIRHEIQEQGRGAVHSLRTIVNLIAIEDERE